MQRTKGFAVLLRADVRHYLPPRRTVGAPLAVDRQAVIWTRKLMRWILCFGLLFMGCSADPDPVNPQEESEAIRILYAPFASTTSIAVDCKTLPSWFELEDTTVSESAFIGKVSRYARGPQFLAPSDSLTHVNTRKWIILPNSLGGDILCIGELWGLEYDETVRGFADSVSRLAS